MKIRKSFVSNSSSTSYIVAIPRDYKFSTDEIKAILEDFNKFEDTPMSEEEGLQEIGRAMEALCSQDYLCDWCDGEDPLPDFIYHIVKIVKDNILAQYETGAGGPTSYVNVLSDNNRIKLEQIQKRIENED